MTNKEWALRYWHAGWSIFPCVNKAPFRDALRNYQGGWRQFMVKRPTEYQIEQWWTNYPGAQIALVCGKISNVTVVDFDWVKDENNVKRPDLSEDVRVLAAKLPITVSSFTGSQGIHKFFNYSNIPGSLGTLHKQVDVKNDGGYVILPPSFYGDYKGEDAYYGWDDLSPWSEDNVKQLADIPQWLHDKGHQVDRERKDWSKITKGVSAGARNTTAASMAGKMLNAFFGDPEPAWRMLYAWNQLNSPPLEEKELLAVFNSILKRDYANSKRK